MPPQNQRSACAAVLACVFTWLGHAHAASPLPPREAWTATSSSTQVAAQRVGHLVDGDPATKTGGAFSPGHWFQIDLGAVGTIAGLRIAWDSAHPEGFTVQLSPDAQAWTTVFAVPTSIGGVETLYFAPRDARYLRIASLDRTQDWGVSIFEATPLGVDALARVDGLAGDDDGVGRWQGGASRDMVAPGTTKATRAMTVALPGGVSTAGLLVDWGGTRGPATLEGRSGTGAWRRLANDPGAGESDTSVLAADAAQDVDALRLVVATRPGGTPAVRQLRLLGPAAVMTPMQRYQIVASRADRALFPVSLQKQQTYWTVVGVHGGLQKSIFDEYGNVEAFKGAPLVQAVWRDARIATSAGAHPVAHTLREGWMPMPTASWSPRAGIAIDSEAFAAEQGGQPVTFVRHRVRNTGSGDIDGTLSLLVRPMQMNPPWQNGGLSPIRDLAIEGAADDTRVRVGGRTLLASLTPVDLRGAAPFGPQGETEITAHAAAGTAPRASRATDPDGLAAGLLGYRVRLAPGGHQDIVVAFPLGTSRADAGTHLLPEAPALDPRALRGDAADAGVAYDARAADVADGWRARLGDVRIALPDPAMVDMLRAQAAYTLINRTGRAMQPGPRNYDRSFIRDGAASATYLLRMGQADVARDFLRWYTDHAVRDSGLVSPILNDDGTNNTGFGSDIEFDAQGQYIALVADVARLDGGAETVRAYLPQVTRALRFLQALRERTLVPGYLADQPAPERFRGLIAPSVSHEGYSSPTHSYWDDYWALKGWHDGAWLAEALGDHGTARWARAQYAALRTSVAASIRATMAWRGIDYVPSSADLGDNDPTSVSIALDPTGQQDLLPDDALRRTFARYLDGQRASAAPGTLYAYSPYELRNVLTYVHLDRPDVADELLTRMFADRRPAGWHVFGEVVHSRPRFPRYLGDMPHTWIGAEYGRSVIGMLLREDDDALQLLPGAPPAWLAGAGIALTGVPTAYGPLHLSARRDGDTLGVTLGPGIVADAPVRLWWPGRIRPARVTVDGRAVTAYDDDGITLRAPFTRLEARW